MANCQKFSSEAFEWSKIKRSSASNETISRDALRRENSCLGDAVAFRIAPVSSKNLIQAVYSESTEEFSLDENWQSSESFPLLIGVTAGAVACALIIILVAMLLVRRFRKNKMDLKLVTKKEFTYNPQPYSLQYGHHLETAHRQMHFQQRLVSKV